MSSSGTSTGGDVEVMRSDAQRLDRWIGFVTIGFVVALVIGVGVVLTHTLSSRAVRGDCFGGLYLNGAHVCGAQAQALCIEVAIPGRFPSGLADDIKGGCQSIGLPVGRP